MFSACLAVAWLCLLAFSDATVILSYPTGRDQSFDSTEAKFGPDLPGGGVGGLLVVASPLDGCSLLRAYNNSNPKIALIQRGTCEFGIKVKNAQLAGYIAAVIFDDIPEGLISMYSEEKGITIPSVLVSQDTGNTMLQAPNGSSVHLQLATSEFPPYVITFITITAAAILVFSLFMFYRYRALMWAATRERHRTQPRTVNLEAVKFEEAARQDVTQCCICLEDFVPDALVATLPCNHVFHKGCIEHWLSRDSQATCPLCKQDPLAPRNATAAAECATERTPLLA